ncbi:MAG TPA: hypothetical protein VGA13_05305 [Acidimicrobiales bacterium]
MTGLPPQAGASWRDVMAAVGELPRLLSDAPDAEAAEGVRYLLRFVAAGIRICVEADDTDAPMLTRSIEHRMSWGLDNPDTTYLYSRLAPTGTYRLSGSRGSARHLEIQVNSGHQGDGDFAGWEATWWRTGDDLGSTVDVEIPPTEGGSFLLIRQYFSDWWSEEPAVLDLQRVDVGLPPPPLDPTTLEQRLGLLAQWLRGGASCWDELSRGLIGGVAPDATEWTVQPFLPPDSASGLKGQAYGMGGWRCASDEALVLTVAPPAARYWGVSLCDRYWQSIDFGQRQSSLNDSQAVADDDLDSRFTMVVAHDDPGVANWLDPGGRSAGSLAVRYLMPRSETLPAVHVRRMALDELDGALPPGLARVDPAERQGALRRRQQAISRRLRW